MNNERRNITGPAPVIGRTMRRAAAARLAPAPVRTRGPIRLAYPTEGRLDAAALLQLLRQQVGGMPLTILAHMWGHPRVESFLKSLLPALRQDDAVWLHRAAGEESNCPPPQHERVAVLDDRKDSDRRFYGSLVYDLAFFPALQANEADLAAGLRRRARAVVVDASGPQSDAVVSAATSARLSTFAWREASGLFERQDGGLEGAETAETPDFASISIALKSAAEQLEQEKDRRPRLRSIIRKLVKKYPRFDQWDETLVRGADCGNWSAWAVECLPSLYVPLHASNDSRRSLVWRYILDCVPESRVYHTHAELCRGQVRDVVLPVGTAQFVERIAPVFERNRYGNPYPSHRSTLGVVIASIIECEIEPSQAPIRNELERVISGLARRGELKDAVAPLKHLTEEELRPGIGRVAQAVNWGSTTVNAIYAATA